jgi:hypothetical protein
METGKAIIQSPGIYEGLPEQVYHGDSYPVPCLSTGVLKNLLMKSPAMAFIKHPALNPVHEEEAEQKFDIGNTAHSLLLEGSDNVRVIDAPDWRTNAAKALRGEARLEGKIPLLLHDWDKVQEMESAARAFLKTSELAINDLQAEGKSEQSFVWTEDGTWFKTRPDWMPNDNAYILDYKTTGISANPAGIERTILNMGYDIQDWLYKRGVYALTGKVPKFVFLFQECSPPYLCSLISLSPQFADMGRRAERGIELWRECLSTGVWPGYPSQICHVEAPAWAAAQWMSEQGPEGTVD